MHVPEWYLILKLDGYYNPGAAQNVQLNVSKRTKKKLKCDV